MVTKYGAVESRFDLKNKKGDIQYICLWTYIIHCDCCVDYIAQFNVLNWTGIRSVTGARLQNVKYPQSYLAITENRVVTTQVRA